MKIRAGWIHASKTRRPGSRALLILRSLGVMWAIAYFASAAIAQTRYQITRIPVASGANSVALGLNDKGEVVGYSFQGDDYHAFLFSYADKSMTEIGSLGGKLNAACAINSAGQVTGYSQDANGNLLAFLFSRNAPIASLGTLEGGSTSEAFGINNSGAVVGDSQSGGQNHRPVLFSNHSVQDLGLGGSNEPDALETAYAINDAGQIVGRHYAGNNAFHAFLFANGNTTDFGTLGGANGEALAINKKGQVVGDSEIADGSAHAFVMSRSRLKDLGTLPGYDNASYARGINNSGDIVGESDSADQKRAFLYTRGRLVELDKLAVNLSEAGFNSLDVAYGINDRGWIVGYGTTSDNLTEAFVAAPAGHGNRPLARGARHGRRHAVIQPQPEEISEPSQEDYNVFYTRLSPDEGDWVEAGDYGYCFRPRVSEDWSLTGTATGFGPIGVGIGNRMNLMRGQPITTAVGSILVGRDGAGYPDVNGLRPGSRGGRVTNMLAGLLFRPKQISRLMSEFLPGPTRTMALDRPLTISSAIPIGLNRATRSTSCHRSEMFRSSARPRMSQTLLPTTT